MASSPRAATDTGRNCAWPWLALALVWFAAGALRPLLEPDEARYAEIPREMAASGDWLTPRLNGLLYFEKPPLQYWATAAAYRAFGVTPFTSRLYSLALGLLTLWLTARLARCLYRSAAESHAAAVVLALSPYFLIVSQLNLLDGAFAALLTLTVLGFVGAQLADSPPASRRYMWLAWVGLALAVLQKGLAAIALPGAALVIYSLLCRDFSPWRRLRPLSGLPLFLLIASGWFILMARRHADFAWFFFLHEHFQRFTSTVHDRAGPLWYFLPILAIALLPWATLWLRAAREAARALPAGGGFQAERFLLVWSAVVLLFFSLSGSKLPPYILPAIPTLAVLLAPRLLGAPRALRWAAALSLLPLVALTIGLCVLARQPSAAAGSSAALWSCLALVALAALATAVGLAKLWHAPALARHWAWLVLPVAIGWLATLDGVALLPQGRSAHALATQVAARIRPSTVLYSVGQYRQSLPPYLGRTMQLVNYAGELEFGLKHLDRPRSATIDEFLDAWQRQTDAVAFIEPSRYAELQQRGLAGQLIGRDHESIAVAKP